eukprot:7087016-Pyramimonas_sp.AAC.1
MAPEAVDEDEEDDGEDEQDMGDEDEDEDEDDDAAADDDDDGDDANYGELFPVLRGRQPDLGRPGRGHEPGRPEGGDHCASRGARQGRREHVRGRRGDQAA